MGAVGTGAGAVSITRSTGRATGTAATEAIKRSSIVPGAAIPIPPGMPGPEPAPAVSAGGSSIRMTRAGIRAGNVRPPFTI